MGGVAISWVPDPCKWVARGRAGLYRGIYASPVFSVRELGLNEEKSSSSSGKLIAILFSGQTPVALKLLIMFGIVNDLYQALANTSQKSYRDTVRPGLEAQNEWQISLHATFKGAKHPMSRGWVRWVVWGGRAQRITFSFAAIRIPWAEHVHHIDSLRVAMIAHVVTWLRFRTRSPTYLINPSHHLKLLLCQFLFHVHQPSATFW